MTARDWVAHGPSCFDWRARRRLRQKAREEEGARFLLLPDEEKGRQNQ